MDSPLPRQEPLPGCWALCGHVGTNPGTTSPICLVTTEIQEPLPDSQLQGGSNPGSSSSRGRVNQEPVPGPSCSSAHYQDVVPGFGPSHAQIQEVLPGSAAHTIKSRNHVLVLCAGPLHSVLTSCMVVYTYCSSWTQHCTPPTHSGLCREHAD
eukprot:9470006-Pyramimonas_sp.AAC.1